MAAHIWVFLILFTGFVAAFLIACWVYTDIDKRNTRLKRRIADGVLYRLSASEFQSYYLVQSKTKKQNSFEKNSINKNIFGQLRLLLARADLKIDFSAVIMLSLAIFGISFSFFLLNHKGIFTNICVSSSLAFFIPYKILSYFANKRKQAFDKVFAESLDIMIRSIKAGFSVNRSMNLIATEAPSPVKEEFQIIADHLNAGQSLETTLAEASERIDLPNFRFFAVCILIQSETGGNLSDALNTLIQVIRKRQEIVLKIKALSSEARASAMIVGSLPFLAAFALSIFNPAHMAVFYNTASGQKWITIMLCLLMTGIFTIRKLIRFKI